MLFVILLLGVNDPGFRMSKGYFKLTIKDTTKT